jgi:hypothetical protein
MAVVQVALRAVEFLTDQGLIYGNPQAVFERLSAWLQARHARWPATANPHLLINRSTGGGTGPVRRSYIQATVRKVEITARDLRADRLLAEAQASGGDPLRLAHLFGISDPTAIRYCADAGGGGLGQPLPAESSIPRQLP